MPYERITRGKSAFFRVIKKQLDANGSLLLNVMLMVQLKDIRIGL